MSRVGRIVCFVLVLCTVSGCGLWTRGKEVGFSDEVVASRNVQRPIRSIRARPQQQSLTVRVQAVSECAVVEQRRVERTTEYDRKSKAPAVFGTLGVVGLVAGGLGTFMVVQADGQPVDPPEHSDELSRAEQYAIGGTMVGIGSVLTLSALLHWAAVGKNQEETEMREEWGDVIRPRTGCAPPLPRSDVPVWLDTRDGRIELGSTAADGVLTSDLSEHVPRTLLVGPSWQRTALVGAGELEMTEVDLTPVRASYDAEAWAGADRTRCAAPQSSDDCDGVKRYLDDFPDGEHADAARELLEDAKEQLRRIAEREQAERRAEAERARLEAERRRREIEEQRRREEERRRAEEERVRREAERVRREAEERAERARREREARERRREQRRECKRKCRSSCSGNAECVQSCVDERCP